MSPSDLHYDDAPYVARSSRFSVLRGFTWIAGALRLLHHAIVSAKFRRLQRELMFRHDYDELFPPDHDAARFPRRPLVLGDKWDF